MLPTTVGNFRRNIADFQKAGFQLARRDKGAGALPPRQNPLLRQFPKRPVNGHAGGFQLLNQGMFRWDPVALAPLSRPNLVKNQVLDLLIERAGSIYSEVINVIHYAVQI